MSTPTPESPLVGQPTPDDLAGTPVCREEGQPVIGVRGRNGKKVHGAPPAPLQAPPTADDLAGTPVCAEGEEDLTVRPHKAGKTEMSITGEKSR